MIETILSSGPSDGGSGEYTVLFSLSGELELSFDEVCELGLYEVGKTVDTSSVCTKILESRMKRYILPYCAYCKRTEAQIIRKIGSCFCEKNGYSGLWAELTDAASQNVLDYLKEEGFADDEAYCASFFRSNSEKDVSTARLSLELQNRGIDRETVRRAAEAAGRNDEEACRRALDKKVRSRMKEYDEGPDEKERASLFRFLSSRGFETGLALKVIDDYDFRSGSGME